MLSLPLEYYILSAIYLVGFLSLAGVCAFSYLTTSRDEEARAIFDEEIGRGSYAAISVVASVFWPLTLVYLMFSD